MVDKKGIDVFSTKLCSSVAPLFFLSFFFSTITPSLGLLLSLWRLMLKASCGFVSEAH